MSAANELNVFQHRTEISHLQVQYSIRYIKPNEIPNHFILIFFVVLKSKEWCALSCNHSNSIFRCEDMFSRESSAGIYVIKQFTDLLLVTSSVDKDLSGG